MAGYRVLRQVERGGPWKITGRHYRRVREARPHARLMARMHRGSRTVIVPEADLVGLATVYTDIPAAAVKV